MYNISGENSQQNLVSLALKLFEIPSPSYHEEGVRDYVMSVLKPLGFTISIDTCGNLLAVRGECQAGEGYPLLSFHMDVVEDASSLHSLHTLATQDVKSRETKAQKSHQQRVHSSPTVLIQDERIYTESEHILGGDDKCGCAIALHLAANTTLSLKIIASVQEEMDCAGIREVDPRFFHDVAYALVLDRSGKHDLVTMIRGKSLCSEQFVQMLTSAAAQVGFSIYPTEGKLSDALVLSEYIDNTVNMSVGYYQPHTIHEFVVINDFFQAYQWVEQAIAILPRSTYTSKKP